MELSHLVVRVEEHDRRIQGLIESAQLLVADMEGERQRIRELRESQDQIFQQLREQSHQIRELTIVTRANRDDLNDLIKVVAQQVQIAAAHENRLQRLEGR